MGIWVTWVTWVTWDYSDSVWCPLISGPLGRTVRRHIVWANGSLGSLGSLGFSQTHTDQQAFEEGCASPHSLGHLGHLGHLASVKRILISRPFGRTARRHIVWANGSLGSLGSLGFSQTHTDQQAFEEGCASLHSLGIWVTWVTWRQSNAY